MLWMVPSLPWPLAALIPSLISFPGSHQYSLAYHFHSLSTFLLCHAQSMKPQPWWNSVTHLPHSCSTMQLNMAPWLFLFRVHIHSLQEYFTLPAGILQFPSLSLLPLPSLSYHLSAGDTSFPSSQRPEKQSEENVCRPHISSSAPHFVLPTSLLGPDFCSCSGPSLQVSPASRVFSPQSWVRPISQEAAAASTTLIKAALGSTTLLASLLLFSSKTLLNLLIGSWALQLVLCWHEWWPLCC